MKSTYPIFFTVYVLLLASTGCKKNNNNVPISQYYLKIKIEGNWVTWKNSLAEIGPDLDNPTKTNFSFQGASDDNKEGFGMSLQVNGSSITNVTYSSDDYIMPGEYTINENGSTTRYQLSDNGPFSKYTITITSITATEVKGNFAGNFFVNTAINTQTIAITEGEFFLKRVR